MIEAGILISELWVDVSEGGGALENEYLFSFGFCAFCIKHVGITSIIKVLHHDTTKQIADI